MTRTILVTTKDEAQSSQQQQQGRLLLSRLSASSSNSLVKLTASSIESSSQLISCEDATRESGRVELTEEERRTLISEGYPIPTRYPLSKAEEKSLKKIRRKIKNKISAQESRRKKKEFVDTLERQVRFTCRYQMALECSKRPLIPMPILNLFFVTFQVELAAAELGEYKRKCVMLEQENATLASQLKSLQKAFVQNNNHVVKVKQEVMQHDDNEELALD